MQRPIYQFSALLIENCLFVLLPCILQPSTMLLTTSLKEVVYCCEGFYYIVINSSPTTNITPATVGRSVLTLSLHPMCSQVFFRNPVDAGKLVSRKGESEKRIYGRSLMTSFTLSFESLHLAPTPG